MLGPNAADSDSECSHIARYACYTSARMWNHCNGCEVHAQYYIVWSTCNQEMHNYILLQPLCTWHVQGICTIVHVISLIVVMLSLTVQPIVKVVVVEARSWISLGTPMPRSTRNLVILLWLFIKSLCAYHHCILHQHPRNGHSRVLPSQERSTGPEQPHCHSKKGCPSIWAS